MHNIFPDLFDHKALSRERACQLMLDIADGKFNENQLAAFMTVYLMRSITPDELIGFSDAVLQRRVTIDLHGIPAIDIVGTGGDGKNTFNISTASCFVVAGSGHKVVKHGNYGSTSVSGASNVLEHFGVKFTDKSERLLRSLEASNMAYLHAPLFSPALKSVAPVRKALKFRTFFNMLGPLVNPIMPRYQLLGVYNLKLMRMYRYIAQKRKVNCTIVHSLDGYDEISLTSRFVANSNSVERILRPSDIGLSETRPESLYGGETIAEAARIFMNVLTNEAEQAQKECVMANSAFAIHTLDTTISVNDAVEMARESIESGRALQTFKTFLEINS